MNKTFRETDSVEFPQHRHRASQWSLDSRLMRRQSGRAIRYGTARPSHATNRGAELGHGPASCNTGMAYGQLHAADGGIAAVPGAAWPI